MTHLARDMERRRIGWSKKGEARTLLCGEKERKQAYDLVSIKNKETIQKKSNIRYDWPSGGGGKEGGRTSTNCFP